MTVKEQTKLLRKLEKENKVLAKALSKATVLWDYAYNYGYFISVKDYKAASHFKTVGRNIIDDMLHIKYEAEVKEVKDKL